MVAKLNQMIKRLASIFKNQWLTVIAVVCALAIISIGTFYFIKSRQDIRLRDLKSIPVSVIKDRIVNSSTIPYEEINNTYQKIVDRTPPIDWNEYFVENRSLNYHLHSWDMISDFLIEYSEDNSNKKELRKSYAIALDWVKNNEVSYVNNQDSNFAWYDMAVGIRAYRLAYIFDQSIRLDIGNDKEYNLLWNSLIDHAIYLSDDDNIIFHNNHGVYQAAGQKAMARRLSVVSGVFNKIQRQADARLAKMLKQQFSSDGVHKEHSPDYHRMVYQTFYVLYEEGLIDREAEDVIIKAGDALYWMIKPDGKLVNFGDSGEKEIVKDTNIFGDISNNLLHYLSDGEKGQQPEDVFKVFEEAGLAVVRSEASYLAQQAAFHSRTHKHADDLTFSWYEGRDILIDSGKYGYKGKTDPKSQDALDGFWYSDPRRQYVESTRAHNTVEIDGMDYLRRGRTPFGSAIVDSGKAADSIYFIRTRVSQFETIDQERLLIYSPGKWLVVVDELKESENKTHNYKQWFQFAPDLDVTLTNKEVVISNIGRTALRAVSLVEGSNPAKPIRGQELPRLQGWYSKNANHFEPTTSLSFNQTGRDAGFVTLFTFSDTPIQVDHNSNTVDKFSWRTGGGKFTIKIDRSESSTQLDYRRE